MKLRDPAANTSEPQPSLGHVRVAVTGASGRLAALLIPDLIQTCAEVIRISRCPGPGTITWQQALEEDGLNGIDIVVHAAWSSVPRTSQNIAHLQSIPDPDLCWQLLTSSAAKKLKQIIFLSSASVYGPTINRNVTEQSPLDPRSIYGATKSYVEQLFSILGASIEINPCILRITNPYGFAYDQHRPQGFVAYALDCLKKSSVLEIWGDGNLPKDYLHISDLSKALQVVMRRGLSGIYNVSSGVSHTAHEVLQLIENIARRKIRLRFSPGYAWDCGMGTICHEKLSAMCGWSPLKTLEMGLLEILSSGNS